MRSSASRCPSTGRIKRSRPNFTAAVERVLDRAERRKRPPDLLWKGCYAQQIEHLRLAAEDLVSYCLDADYKDLGWPEGYWPETAEPPSEEAWNESIDRLLQATEAMAALVEIQFRCLAFCL